MSTQTEDRVIFRNTQENLLRELAQTGVLDRTIRTILQGRSEEMAAIAAETFGVVVGGDYMLGADEQKVFLVMTSDKGATFRSMLVLRFERDIIDPEKATVRPYYLTTDTSASLKSGGDIAALFKAFDRIFLPALMMAAIELEGPAN